jgi:hypothetical protein
MPTNPTLPLGGGQSADPRVPVEPAPVATRANLNLQRAILEAAPNPIVGVDAGGLIAYVNPQAQLTFGYPASALLGQPIELLVAERAAGSHVARRNAFIQHPVARPMGIGLDLAGRRADGSEFPVEISLSPVQTPEGLQVFATVVDITARKAAEIALAESERRFRTVLEASPNAIVAVGPDDLITYANPRAAEAFGYAVEELVGAPFWMLLPERVRERHVGHRNRFLEHPLARPMGIGLDLAGRRKDGREFPVEISLSPVETPDGLLVFATVVDITARKQAEQQLLQAQKLESIGRLAGGVAHDFNNILFAINGYAELLLEDLRGADGGSTEAGQSVSAIMQAAERGATLTSQLLAFSRQRVVSPAIVDASEVIRNLEPMLRRLIGEHIRLGVQRPSPGGLVRIDPGQLDQIVMNLVVNARDAMPDGGSVEIEIGTTVFEDAYALEHFEVEPGEYVMIAVSDTGLGMDVDTREHIFEPFFTTKEQGRGTGLGLATTYGIVRQAGGHIWLYSEPGRGSTFKLYFPRVDERPTPEQARPPRAAAARATGTILLVEDEPAVRDMTRRMLERAGYSVTAVPEGRIALATLDSGVPPPDILVTDVVMPELSGVELAQRVLDRAPATAVVLLSGYTPENLDLEGLLARGAAFVTKPVASSELLRAVEEARLRTTPTGRDGPA